MIIFTTKLNKADNIHIKYKYLIQSKKRQSWKNRKKWGGGRENRREKTFNTLTFDLFYEKEFF